MLLQNRAASDIVMDPATGCAVALVARQFECFNVGDRVVKRQSAYLGHIVELILGCDNGSTGVVLYRVTFEDQAASSYEDLAATDLQSVPGLVDSTVRVTRGVSAKRTNWKLLSLNSVHCQWVAASVPAVICTVRRVSCTACVRTALL